MQEHKWLIPLASTIDSANLVMTADYSTIYSDGNGKEVISLYKTEIDNGKVFWGDQNGRQMLWRKYPHTI